MAVLKFFEFDVYQSLSDSDKNLYIRDFKISEFKRTFNWKDDVSPAEFLRIINNDRKVNKWLKDLNTHIMRLQLTPRFANLDDIPDEVRSIVLKDKELYDEILQELNSDMDKMVLEWNKSEKLLNEKRKEKFKDISNYYLVTTLEIKDIPLNRKRKLIKLEVVGDEESVKLAGKERKALVEEYKREIFQILLKNNGEFPEGIENPFLEKF